jgi:hypothetical protein
VAAHTGVRALTHTNVGLAGGMQDWARALHEGDGTRERLPGMAASGPQAFGFHPAAHRPGRDASKGWIVSHTLSHFRSTQAARAARVPAWARAWR